MKTFLQIALLLVLLIADKNACAQKNMFIRLYDLDGKKIGKGNLLPGTDSTIEVLRDKKTNTFSIAKVGSVKTRRTFGHSVLVGTGIGVGLGTVAGIISASTNDIEDQVTSFDAGLIALGLPYVGALVGTIVAAATKRKSFEINGDAAKWKPVKVMLLSK